MPKNFEPAIKERAVRMVLEQLPEYASLSQACAAVGASLGVGKETLRTWVRKAQIDAGEREGLTTAEDEEIKRLKAENRRLREDVAILKAATTFFAGELDPRRR